MYNVKISNPFQCGSETRQANEKEKKFFLLLEEMGKVEKHQVLAYQHDRIGVIIYLSPNDGGKVLGSGETESDALNEALAKLDNEFASMKTAADKYQNFRERLFGGK